MTDLNSATPKTYTRTISSSTEHFAKFPPPYLIRHFEFWKFNGRFGFSDPKNLCIDNFIEFRTFFKILTAILDPPFWVLKIHWQIWIQRPRKPVCGQFHGVLNIFQNFDRHIEFRKFNGKFKFSDPKNLCTDNFIEFWTFFKILTAILDPPFRILKIWHQIRI